MPERTQSVQTNAQGYNPITEVRLIIAFVTLLSLCITSEFVGTKVTDAAPATFSYSCNDHCYGRNVWPGNTRGGITTVDVNPMGSGNGFVTNEIWVDDPNSNHSESCKSSDDIPDCWIEAGYASGGSNNGATEYYFWADVRPCGCGGYHEHDSPQINTNDYGGTANIVIEQGGASSCTGYNSSTWCIDVSGGYDGISGLSDPNTMHASSIFIGQELVGTSDVYAPTAHFTYNNWVNSSGQPQYQTVDGNLDPCLDGICPGNNPPWAGWVSGQDPRNSRTGGNFYTCSLPGSRNPC